MSETEQTLVFVSRGIGRWFDTLFMGVWLVFWVVFEFGALAILVAGALSYLGILEAGRPGGENGVTPWVVVPFLLFWLTFWTLAGLAAGHHFMRRLVGKDVLILQPSRIVVQSQGGFKSKRLTIPAADLLAVTCEPRGDVLVVKTISARHEITTLGTAEERRAAAEALRHYYGESLASRKSVSGALPSGWEESWDAGTRIIQPAARMRKRGGAVLAFIAGLLGIGLIFIGRTVLIDDQIANLPIFLMMGVIFLASAWGAFRLLGTQPQWVIGSGSLRFRRKIVGRYADEWTVASLRFDVSHDDDGDPWYALHALGVMANGQSREIQLCKSLKDDSEPLNLGRWLHEHTGIRFASSSRLHR